MEDIKVGLVVLNYNNFDETWAFVQRVRSIERIDILSVVDNCSSDGSGDALDREILALNDPAVVFVKSGSNCGYGSGNNIGANYLYDQYGCGVLIVANPDVYFDEVSIESCVTTLFEKDGAAIAPRMLLNGCVAPMAAWKLPTKRAMLKDSFLVLRPLFEKSLQYPWLDSSNLLTKGVKQVDVIAGSLIVFDMKKFQAVGGFDEDTFLYGEENIIFAKLKKEGWRSFIDLNHCYDHKHGTSIRKAYSSVFKRYTMTCDSNLVYARKILKTGKGFGLCCKAIFLVNARVLSLAILIKERAVFR